MSRGDRRKRIPLAHADTQLWPTLDESRLTRQEQDELANRRAAVEMFARGSSFEEIKAVTGRSKSDVYRYVERCLTPAPDGAIYGFRALLRGTRVVPYQRRKEVEHAPGSGSGGCSGALSQLFSRFPEVEDLIKDLYFKQNNRGTMPEARIGMRAIHDAFQKELRRQGLTDSDWPFNTSNCGYKSIWQYCCRLREADVQHSALARSGADAARRGSVGNGIPRLLPPLRPYGAVILDFHKVDAASVIVLTNDYGEEFEVPLARWHFGLVVEESRGGALGFCVALELTPSADSTLEAISSALSSHAHALSDVLALSPEKFLVNQLMPELAYQCFSVLKVDNGWSNAAHEVVNNIIDTVGCAVNFGPTRAWWRRDLIERIFGEFTRRGLQRLPSTHGKGPGDTRSANPNQQAVKFRIHFTEIIAIFRRCQREHNLSDTERLQWTAPIKTLQAAYANPASGFFSQPLPLQVQAHAKLMMHVEEVTVRGDIEKNVRPYFNLDRHKHTNPTLANSYWLIGKKLIVYLDRRLARIVYATVKDTGEQLGLMHPSGPWAHSDCSWRDRKLMTRSGMARRYGASTVDPLEQTKLEKIEQLKALSKSRRRKSSRTALEVAKIERQQARAKQFKATTAPETESIEGQPVESPKADRKDPFGLNEIPSID
jgi:hypothetical protein